MFEVSQPNTTPMNEVSIPELLVGFGLGLVTQYVSSRLRLWETATAQRTKRAQGEIQKGSAPAIQLMNDMIDDFPAHESARNKLREHFANNSHLFSPEDAEHVWIATSKLATVDDLIQARDLLRLRQDSKAG